VTKPVEKAVEFIPTEQRTVRAGEKAEHRKFKVTGEVVSIDAEKAVLNVNGRRMTVETRDLVPKGGAAAPAKGRAETRPASNDVAAIIAAELNLIGQRVDDALEESGQVPRPRPPRRQTSGAHHPWLRHRHPAQGDPRAPAETPRGSLLAAGGENEGGDGATIACRCVVQSRSPQSLKEVAITRFETLRL
jgi:hypothetical protein